MPEQLICAVTGEVLDSLDVDQLAAHWEFLRRREDEIRQSKESITRALLNLVPDGDAKTLRAVGKERVVKLEKPGDGWDQAGLRSLWMAGGKWAGIFLRVKEVAVNLVELKKYQASGGDSQLSDFLAHLKDAQRKGYGLPRVVVEK